MAERTADAYIDLRGVGCPLNAARALIKLAGMALGQVLEVALDDGEPYVNVSRSLQDEGHRIVHEEQTAGSWKLWIERG